jgi:hypothetical protein
VIRRGGVGMARDEDDRGVVSPRAQIVVEPEPGLTRHAHVEQEATRRRTLALEEVSRRGERFHPVAGRLQEALEPAADRVIVVDDGDGRDGVRQEGLSSSFGKLKWKAAPRVRLFVAQMLPPWASTIDRAMERPMPIPVAFVV